MAGGIQTTGGLSSPCYRHPSVTHHNPNWTHNPKHLKFHCKSVLRGTTEQIADTQQGLLSGGELSATTRRKNNSMSVAHSIMVPGCMSNGDMLPIFCCAQCITALAVSREEVRQKTQQEAISFTRRGSKPPPPTLPLKAQRLTGP